MTQQIPPPLNLQYATQQPAGPNVRAVGLAQRRMMWALLGLILLAASIWAGAAITLAATGVAQIAIIGLLALVRLGLLVVVMVFIYQMAAALGSSTTSCVLYVIAMIIPLVNLIILLVVNQRATNLLKWHGIKVGFMGARVSDLPAA